MNIKFSQLYSKWLPLALLSFTGMFLSEFLIWNVSVFSHVLNENWAKAIVFLVVGFLMYFSIFVVFTDIIQRLKIKDTISILLLGCIYGLFLEGLADIIYGPGFGPKIMDLWLIRTSFTALSWHPLVDFLFGFILLRYIFSGKINFQDKKIKLKEILIIFSFVFYWTSWSYANWLIIKMPQGMPLNIQIAILSIPMITFGILFFLVFKYSKGYFPEKILNWKIYPIFILILLFFITSIFNKLPNKSSFYSLLVFIAVYILLLILYLKSKSIEKSSVTFYEKIFPVVGSFSITKYLKISFFVIISYIGIRWLVFAANLQTAMTAVSSIFYFLFMIFSVIFPIFVIIKIFHNLYLKITK